MHHLRILKILSSLFMVLLPTWAMAASQFGSNSSNVNIPDNNSTWTAFSSIVINAAPAGAVVTGIDIHIEIIHPYVGDLEVVLTDNDAIPTVIFWSREGGSQDNINKTWTSVSNYNGQAVNQTWTLWARDLAAGDAGYIDYWSITVYYNTSNTAPNQPTALSQFRSDGVTGIPVGGTTPESTAVFKGGVSDPDGGQVKLQIELRRLDEFGGTFTGNFTHESGLVASGSTASITVTGLIDGQYHWRGRTVDTLGAVSSWVPAGGNADSAADFVVASPPVRAKGRVAFRDNQNRIIGLRNATVKLMDDDGSFDFNDQCAIDVTDLNGNFDLSGNCGDPYWWKA